jgi:cytochrome c peroxidase
LEEQIQGVFDPDGDMAIDVVAAYERVRDDPIYQEWLSTGGEHSGAGRIVDALVAFQEALELGDSRFDRFYFGGDVSALTEQEKHGWQVFRGAKAGCSGCHLPIKLDQGKGPSLFAEDRFHNLGVGMDNGRMLDHGHFTVSRRPRDMGSFRTPSLRNVALTAPYMHDGSLATLGEVVEFYTKGGNPNPTIDPIVKPLKLSSEDKAALEAFLRSLTSIWLEDVKERERTFQKIGLLGTP